MVENSGGNLHVHDGRHARRDRNRDAVTRAFIDLVREGTPRPSVAEVAARSGLSYRSVFRYFREEGSTEFGLPRTAIRSLYREMPKLAPLRVGPGDALDARVEGLVDQRLRVHSAVDGVAQLLRSLAVQHDQVRDDLRQVRATSRDQVAWLFGRELSLLAGDDRADLLALLDAAVSFDHIDLLCSDQGFGVERARRLLVEALRAHLAAHLLVPFADQFETSAAS